MLTRGSVQGNVAAPWATPPVGFDAALDAEFEFLPDEVKDKARKLIEGTSTLPPEQQVSMPRSSRTTMKSASAAFHYCAC